MLIQNNYFELNKSEVFVCKMTFEVCEMPLDIAQQQYPHSNLVLYLPAEYYTEKVGHG